MIQDVFQAYLNRLMDLSAKNRSVYLPKLVASQMVDLRDFQFMDQKNAFYYIQELLGRKKKVELVRASDARDKSINQVSQRLKRLAQQVKLAEEETGEKNLFVGWPFVEGKLINDQVIRCPLIFFPVALVQEDEVWLLKKKSGDQPFINKTFLLAYAHSHEKSFKEEWFENALEEFSKDPTAFRTELYHYLKKEFTLNFTQDLFEDKIEEFPDTNRTESEKQYKTGVLQLKSYALLGQFSQKSSFLIRDYEELMGQYASEDLEDLFARWFAPDIAMINAQKEGNLFNTFPLDASQEEVMKATRAGMSCVVEGPPGTGKSQLICNLVTDFTSRGKKVLVVSQKRAALDVVQERLQEQGFGAFLALVHDFRADRTELFKKLSDQIRSLDSYKELNRSLDAIQLERSYSQTVKTIESHAEFLEEYRHALFNTEECGTPIKALYVTSSLEDEHLDMTQYYKHYKWEVLDEFFRDFQEYVAYHKKYENADSFWLHRVDFAEFTPNVIQRFKETLTEVQELKETAEQMLGDLLHRQFEFPLVYQSFEHKDRLREIQHLIHQEENFEALKRLISHKTSEIDLLWLESKGEIIKKLLSEEGIEWTIPDGEVEGCYQKALHVLVMKDSWWKSFALKWNKQEFTEVWDLLEKNELENNKEGLNQLIVKLENRLNLNHQYTLLDSKEWIDMPEKPFDFAVFNHRFHVLMDAVKARLIMEDLGMLTSFLVGQKTDYEQFEQIIEELIGINNLIAFKIENWSRYLSMVQIKHLLTAPDEEKLLKVKGTLIQDFSEIVALDRLKKKVRGVDLEIMRKLMDSYPDHDFKALKKIFIAGLKLSWIEHIEAKYPVLQEMSVHRVKQVLEEFSGAVEEKLKVCRFITELRLREQTFQELEYNRLGNRLTYRELSHQVNKKKRLWTVKKLVDHFEEEVFKLIPCWLASPETVSALFSLRSCFDLVIFDESSQCFAERGIPAMLRGKQVVIAGDSQQLQPFDLYKVRLEEEGEDLALETDSLLDLASGYFKKYSLEGHYRSKSLSLIHFSNLHFYKGKLNMLPEMNSLNEEQQAFEWVKVNGVWDKQTNQQEVDIVIDQLKEKFKEAPEDSIGVITFNYYQMMLIADRVAAEKALTNSKIKIRNIENVQGDEFDTVIFSVGYAPNKSGKFTANFGMLSKSGGGNRLNVAVTRARKKIVLISSLEASDFKMRQLANPGVKLLRDYLAYVEGITHGEKVKIQEYKASGFQVEWYLKHKLRGSYGSHMVQENTLSQVMDLELLEGGKYRGAILTDDSRLFGAKSAKEAFVYHPRLLRSKGWNILHVFSRQYWIDKEDLLQTKIKILEEEK